MERPSRYKTWAIAEETIKNIRELQRRAEFQLEVFEHVINQHRLIHVKVFYQLWLHAAMWLYPQELMRLTRLSKDSVYRVLDDLREDGFIDERAGKIRLSLQPETNI